MVMPDDFAVFILTYGRADRVHTYDTLRRQGYTGRIYLICSDDDASLRDYRARYAGEVIVFNKDAYAHTFDIGDNFDGQNVVVFARNAAFDIAKQLKLRIFLELDDDYNKIRMRMPIHGELRNAYPMNLDRIFLSFIEFLETTPVHCIAMAQSGDYIGGTGNVFFSEGYVPRKRKIMNSFFNRVDRPYQFFGRINEDVNCYVENGKRGLIFLTHPLISVNQLMTQTNAGGLTDIYLAQGTYVKSFYTLLYNPAAVTIQMMGTSHPRIHHNVQWKYAVPCIIRSDHKKLAKTA